MTDITYQFHIFNVVKLLLLEYDNKAVVDMNNQKSLNALYSDHRSHPQSQAMNLF